MKTVLYLLWGLVLFTLSGVLIAADGDKELTPQVQPRVQVAVLLDTSGSMQGLINQARTELWEVVNEFAAMEKDGNNVTLEVALYEYGKDSIPAAEGYLRMIVPLTTDLDKVSEELFALTTNGGSEYCGKVIKAATEGLAWDASPDVLKAIFIAGNEPFTQGDVDFRVVCPATIARGIVVNTIHCGAQEEGERTGWKDGALLADGQFMNINHDSAAIVINAPQDKQIAELNSSLNTTYIPYGKFGKEGQSRQMAQDANSLSNGVGNLASRAAAKASVLYTNAGWDLVDAVQDGKVKLVEVKTEDLPENMQTMTPEEREAFVKEQTAKREKLQAQIAELANARKQYVAEEMKKRAAAGDETLQNALIQAVRTQAEKKGYHVEMEK